MTVLTKYDYKEIEEAIEIAIGYSMDNFPDDVPYLGKLRDKVREVRFEVEDKERETDASNV